MKTLRILLIALFVIGSLVVISSAIAETEKEAAPAPAAAGEMTEEADVENPSVKGVVEKVGENTLSIKDDAGKSQTFAIDETLTLIFIDEEEGELKNITAGQKVYVEYVKKDNVQTALWIEVTTEKAKTE